MAPLLVIHGLEPAKEFSSLTVGITAKSGKSADNILDSFPSLALPRSGSRVFLTRLH
ncbi:hypothetical protein CPter91_0832 [Collimonas pratensis]|uniref:Uncharacterized protein n=1 Tax=Collimonas pratensis TaxID=279113 RepID=A0A127PZG3_9BURK|nr:hypothetical protein CPter91_0832 [Collimonas pratensis]